MKDANENDVMRWTQTNIFSNQFELYSGSHKKGELTMNLDNLWGTKEPITIARCQFGNWLFYTAGNMTHTIEISHVEDKNPIAQFSLNYDESGQLHFFDGNQFLWKSDNFSKTMWLFEMKDSKKIISFKLKHSILKMGGQVQIHSADWQMPELYLLLHLGWHLVLLLSNKISQEIMLIY